MDYLLKKKIKSFINLEGHHQFKELPTFTTLPNEES